MSLVEAILGMLGVGGAAALFAYAKSWLRQREQRAIEAGEANAVHRQQQRAEQVSRKTLEARRAAQEKARLEVQKKVLEIAQIAKDPTAKDIRDALRRHGVTLSHKDNE